MKAYPKYKGSSVPWIGEVPEHWSCTPLRGLLCKFSDKGHPAEPLLSVTREQGVIVRDVTSKEENHNFIPDDLAKYKRVMPGDFVVNKMKAWQGSYGISVHRGIVSPAYFTYHLRNQSCLSHFFHEALRSRAYSVFFARASDGVRIGQWDLDENKMKQIVLCIPPHDEQHVIADYLDKKCAEIDELVSRRQQMIEKLRELKRSIIAQAVTKGIRSNRPMKDSGVPWLGEVPKDWNIIRFRNTFAERNQKVSDKEYPPLSVTKNGVVQQLSDVAKTDNGDNRKLVKVGDYVVNSRSDRKGSSGVSALEGSVSLINIVLIPLSHWHGLYIHHLLRSQSFTEEFYRNGHGIVGDLWTTKMRDISSCKLPLPSHAEQREIADYLDKKCAEIDEMIARHTGIIEKLKELKVSLIANVVTGKVDVRTQPNN